MTATKTPAISATVEGTRLTITTALPGGAESFTVDVLALSDEIKMQACLHGLKQKIVDAAAIPRDTETGRSASITDKFNAMSEVVMRITDPVAPSWNKTARGDGSGSTGGAGGLLAEALMEITGKSRDAVLEFLAKKTKKEQAALRDTEKVGLVIARIKAARSTVDTDDLLGDLMD